jgi:predicted RNA-binding protein YlqC (UPF0109 family)
MSEVQQDGEQVIDVLTPVTKREDLHIDVLEEEVINDLPEKFKGKTAKEIAASALEAEKLIGRQGKELGELRSIVDGYIKSQLGKPANVGEKEEDKHLDPQMEAGLRSIRKIETELKLRDTHQDYKEIVADPDFVEWIGTSKVRTKLFNAADQEYDFDAADELFGNWKELKLLKATKEVEEKAEDKRKVDLKAAKTGSGTGSMGAGKKVYLRADLIKLRQYQPDKYNSLQDEIQQAYAEGRVR